jgi:putative sugar O-methyltransferase
MTARLNMRRFVLRGDRRFDDDPRYDLQSVTEGFVARPDDGSPNAALLDRICTAYMKAVKQQQFAHETYQATEWWEQQQRSNLKPVIQALMTRDIDTLREMYRNFYRDPCSAGLITLQSIAKDYFGETIKDLHRRFYLADALYRIDYWKARTGDRFLLRDLDAPLIGNPFGVMIEGTLVRAGAEYHHHCAHRISGLLGSKTSTVVEIGGGFGGMAYYLLRDRPGTTYIDFDVPESIALTSYYLLRAFPQLNFLLYGEQELTKETLSQADVVLMPAYELAAMPAASADVIFSSHAISDLSHAAMAEYLSEIARITRDYFLYVGNSPSGRAISALVDRQCPSFRLMETRPSEWHSHLVPGTSEVEGLYRVGRV